MKFTVERSKWNHALKEDMGEIMLLNSEKNMCCLGFVSLQCGYKEADIYNKYEPFGIGIIENGNVVVRKNRGGNIENTPLAFSAMVINDDVKEDKEERLQQLFKEYGHTIEFV